MPKPLLLVLCVVVLVAASARSGSAQDSIVELNVVESVKTTKLAVHARVASRAALTALAYGA